MQDAGTDWFGQHPAVSFVDEQGFDPNVPSSPLSHPGSLPCIPAPQNRLEQVEVQKVWAFLSVGLVEGLPAVQLLETHEPYQNRGSNLKFSRDYLKQESLPLKAPVALACSCLSHTWVQGNFYISVQVLQDFHRVQMVMLEALLAKGNKRERGLQRLLGFSAHLGGGASFMGVCYQNTLYRSLCGCLWMGWSSPQDLLASGNLVLIHSFSHLKLLWVCTFKNELPIGGAEMKQKALATGV